MTPAERASSCTTSFGYSFAEVAQIVGRSPVACRQLASSARRRIRASITRFFVGQARPGLTILERTVNGQPGLVAQLDGVSGLIR
jgi:hypothetical protein